MGNNFSLNQVPDLSNKVFVITGANSGIGYVTAMEIARHNGDVIMCCRSEERAIEAIKKIHDEFEKTKLETYGKIEYINLDLMSMKSAETAARAIVAKYPKIDCLINNAGIMACPFQITQDNIESQFGTNHMGHFVFTMLLLPTIVKTPTARIVNLSSMGHSMAYSGGLQTLEQLVVTPGPPDTKSPVELGYKRWSAYGSSKLANLLFTKYLASKLPILCYAVHPGLVNTDLGRNMTENATLRKLSKSLGPLISKKPTEGAITSLRAATDPTLDSEEGRKLAPSGTYFVPQGKPEEPSKYARDPKLAVQLWDLSVSICKLVLGDQVTDEIEANLKAASVKPAEQ